MDLPLGSPKFPSLDRSYLVSSSQAPKKLALNLKTAIHCSINPRVSPTLARHLHIWYGRVSSSSTNDLALLHPSTRSSIFVSSRSPRNQCHRVTRVVFLVPRLPSVAATRNSHQMRHWTDAVRFPRSYTPKTRNTQLLLGNTLRYALGGGSDYYTHVYLPRKLEHLGELTCHPFEALASEI